MTAASGKREAAGGLLAVAGVGVCATGLPDWNAARAVLRGDTGWQSVPLAKLDIPALPMTERRRANATSRLAIHAATQAVASLPDAARMALASVFASANGDGQVLANTLDVLAQPAVAMSPMLFHNSVFNAPAGYWTIASRAPAASTTVSAGASSFAAGLLEAGVQVVTTGLPVLYVAFDMPFPESLDAFGVTGDTFACAMLLAPAGAAGGAGWGTLGHWQRIVPDAIPSSASGPFGRCFDGNAAAAGLPLLEAIARRVAGSIRLPYLDGGCVELDYRP